MKRPHPYQSESRQASQNALIVFAIIYVGVFFSTLFVHNGFIARPFRQTRGPAPPLSGKDAQIPKGKVSRQTTYDGRPSAVLGEITDGEAITSMLLGEIPFSADTKAQRLRFQPGTLNLTQAHTLRHCYAEPTVYQSHYPSSDRQVTSVSDYYKLLYLLIPKAGSSTGRWIMGNVLRGGNVGLNPAGDDLIRKYRNYTVLTFVRDPLNRFYSQYDEVFLRYGPWMQKKEGRAWKGLKRFKHPYPYLYENFTVWEDYQSLFCPLHKVHDVDHTTQWCSMQQTKDNGPLASRFERFVWDYNGVSPWDLHLHLQVPHISNKNTGRPRRVDEVYNTETTIGDWEYIVDWYGQELPEEGQFGARSVPRRFNIDLVSIETKRRICQLSAIDYCCLNMQLPPECEEAGVYCSLDRNKGGAFRIQPWYHPHEV